MFNDLLMLKSEVEISPSIHSSKIRVVVHAGKILTESYDPKHTFELLDKNAWLVVFNKTVTPFRRRFCC